jgi:sulfur carrier protein
MKIVVNGSERAVQARQVEELVSELGLPLAAVLVEHNGVALLRSEWTGATLAEGDRIELVRMVAGG